MRAVCLGCGVLAGVARANVAQGFSSLAYRQVLHYPLEEGVGGDRLDMVSGGGRGLAPSNAPTGGVGRRGGGLALISASTQDVRRADQPIFRKGDTFFAVAVWVNLITKAATQSVAGKSLATGNQREWQIAYLTSATDRFAFLVSGNGTSNTQVLANSFGSPVAGVWHLLYAEHDPIANTIGISVNGGPLDTASHTTGVFGGTGAFCIGSANGASPGNHVSDELRIWDRKLTQAEVLRLFNAGLGLGRRAFKWRGL